MSTTRESVEHVAKLARLELTADEAERYTRDLNNILGLVQQLNEIDLSDIAIDLRVDEPTVFREDVAVRGLDRETILATAPAEEDGFFRVPKILGDS